MHDDSTVVRYMSLMGCGFIALTITLITVANLVA